MCAYALGRGPVGDKFYLPERAASPEIANLHSQVGMRKAKRVVRGVPSSTFVGLEMGEKG